MAELDENSIRDALRSVSDPVSGGNLVDNNRIQGVVIRQGNIGFSIEISPEEADAMEAARQKAEMAVRALKGVLSATAILTSHSTPPASAPTAQKTAGKTPSNDEKIAAFDGIKKVIAVASGKGGVGKSTVAVNLALALAQAGHKTGLLDADIYGPSLPALLGITEKPEVTEAKKLLPIARAGLQTMSIGYMVPPEQAMIWRGPMVQSALVQLLKDVDWPELDVLVLDLPPGTGDIQLTMAQRFPVDGALIVSTPHPLAIADVRRAVAMFKKVNVPVLGLVENMAYIDLPTGDRLEPFGPSIDQNLLDDLTITRLTQLPLAPALQTTITEGHSIFTNPATVGLAEQFTTLAAHSTQPA